MDPQTGEKFAISACPECGLSETVNLPEDLGKYYGPAYYGSRHSLTKKYCDRRRVRMLGQIKKEGAALLDVGCGDGSFLLAAQRAGWTVSGVEINPEPARAAGLSVSEEIEDGQFDCITLWHSLEHMRDPLGTMARLRGMLKRDGVMLVSVPDAGGPQARVFGRRWLHLDVPRHCFHFDSRSMDLLLRKAGLRTTQRWNSELEYDLSGWVQSALNCVVKPPNVLIYSLMGKTCEASRTAKAVSYVGGAALVALALPFAWGGTLVVAAVADI
jgi:SAM-dependent methyltransferase